MQSMKPIIQMNLVVNVTKEQDDYIARNTISHTELFWQPFNQRLR